MKTLVKARAKRPKLVSKKLIRRPITFLHAQRAHVKLINDQPLGFVMENDTTNPYTQDSDTN
jgi:hypothetical protein